MQKFILVILVIFANATLSAQDVQSSPENVINAIFEAGKNKNFETLTMLCDPEGDGDVQYLCDMVNLGPEDQTEFCEYFKDGYISGEIVIKENMATVPIKFGPGATEDEKIELVKKDDKWYLMSF